MIGESKRKYIFGSEIGCCLEAVAIPGVVTYSFYCICLNISTGRCFRVSHDPVLALVVDGMHGDFSLQDFLKSISTRTQSNAPGTESKCDDDDFTVPTFPPKRKRKRVYKNRTLAEQIICDAARAKRYRVNFTEEQRANYNAKCRLRMRKYREKIKMQLAEEAKMKSEMEQKYSPTCLHDHDYSDQ